PPTHLTIISHSSFSRPIVRGCTECWRVAQVVATKARQADGARHHRGTPRARRCRPKVWRDAIGDRRRVDALAVAASYVAGTAVSSKRCDRDVTPTPRVTSSRDCARTTLRDRPSLPRDKSKSECVRILEFAALKFACRRTRAVAGHL